MYGLTTTLDLSPTDRALVISDADGVRVTRLRRHTDGFWQLTERQLRTRRQVSSFKGPRTLRDRVLADWLVAQAHIKAARLLANDTTAR